MNAHLVFTLVCALVVGALSVVACGGSPAAPTIPSPADGGTSVARDHTPHEAAPREGAPRESAGHDHEHGH